MKQGITVLLSPNYPKFPEFHPPSLKGEEAMKPGIIVLLPPIILNFLNSTRPLWISGIKMLDDHLFLTTGH